MTTREFINKAFTGETRATKCSSVFKDGNNDIYSYGYHYPLLFRVGNKVIRNVRGYSNTTARHISNSRDIQAIDIHTLYDFRLSGDDDKIMAELLKGQNAYIDSLNREMGAKTRKDTQVYASLQREFDRAVANARELQA